MRKKDWKVYAVYYGWDNELKAADITVHNVRKNDAIAEMYDYLCWSKDGQQIGFRNVIKVFARND